MSDRIESVLLNSLQMNVSDIFLSSGRVPACRVCGDIVFPKGEGPLTQEEIDLFRTRVLTPVNENLYQTTGSIDASWSHPSGPRFRINFFTSFNYINLSVNFVFNCSL